MIPTSIPTPHRAPHPPPATRPLRILLGSLPMLEVCDLAITEAEAERSWIAYRWSYGVRCPTPDCGSETIRKRRGYKRTNEVPVRFFCQACGRGFTVRTNYFLAESALPFQVWFWALYLVMATSELEPVTPASLVRQLGVSEGCAGHMIQRILDNIRDTGRWAKAL